MKFTCPATKEPCTTDALCATVCHKQMAAVTGLRDGTALELAKECHRQGNTPAAPSLAEALDANKRANAVIAQQADEMAALTRALADEKADHADTQSKWNEALDTGLHVVRERDEALSEARLMRQQFEEQGKREAVLREKLAALLFALQAEANDEHWNGHIRMGYSVAAERLREILTAA